MSKAEQSNSKYKYVKYLWNDEDVKNLDGVDRLVYRSNRLGDDLTLTNTGGGNTSSKLMMPDPLTKEEVEVLWLKGSGGDLRTAKRDGFASLYLDKVRDMRGIYENDPNNGAKTLIEDEMYPMYSHCVYNCNPRACSIDTPLHTLVPFKHVDHLHPNAVIAIAASVNQEKLTKEIYGEDVIYIPWQRPGFDIGLKIEQLIKENPKAKGILLGHHGMSSWDNDDKTCYETALEIIDRAAQYIESKDKGENTFGGQKYKALDDETRQKLQAEIIPFIRGQVSIYKRFVGTVQDDFKMLRFVNSNDAPRLAELGTSCPDHFLRTKIKPLFVNWNPETGDLESLKTAISEGLVQYRKDYEAYYNRCKHPDSPAMRDPNPTVVLIPGLGMIAWGKNKSESRVTGEFYNCAIEVMRGAEAMDEYEAMDQQEAFDIEYWLLEEAKLQRMPPEKELDRQIHVIIGAGAGIGKETAFRLVKEGAHIVCVDLNETAAKETANEIIAKYGAGIGVSGTGISNCGVAIGLGCDMTNRESVAKLFEKVMLAYGGIDSVIVTAGVFVPPDKSGRLEDSKWDFTFGINVKGAFIVADEAYKVFKKQGLTGNVVLTTSANAVVAKKGSLAYDTSKAAANHLVRELAIEYSPLVRVNAVAPATVVKGSTMFPRDRVIASLAKYNIEFDEAEETEELTEKLSNFYAKRSLTQTPIEPSDQAEAIFLLVSKRLGKTTGHIIPVDGGLADGFMR
ncbi:MAG: bifunctional rhamnulose-1-phosphate aldolase/short-chain dehydrogenase [Pyrinomonadaceae bacterium]|nr:bifunctional rhamnulose-1-phosphate aldolase/short-chain dehydrogenase [Pyrinomonadaceae bacterium]